MYELILSIFITIGWLVSFSKMMEGKAGGFSLLLASNLIGFSFADIDEISFGMLSAGIVFLLISFSLSAAQKQEIEERKRKRIEQEKIDKIKREAEKKELVEARRKKEEAERKELMEAKRKKEEEKIKYENEKKKEIDAIEFRKSAFKIYKKCVEKNITSFDSEDKISALAIIASTYGVNDILFAQKSFFYGRLEELLKERIDKLEKIELEKRKFLEQKEARIRQDKISFEKAKAISKLKGKEKYTYAYENFKYFKPINLNARRAIDEKLIDVMNQEEKFDLLELSISRYYINEANNFEVTFEYSLKNDINIIDAPAKLDGSLKIEIFDNETLVAQGIYNAGGENYVDISAVIENNMISERIGFKRKDCVKCVCISNENFVKNQNTNYQIKISPLYLWIIEK